MVQFEQPLPLGFSFFIFIEKSAIKQCPNPILWIVIPCYNEEQVLPITAPMFLEKRSTVLTAQGLVSDKSRVLFVNDGSRDKTWELIQGFAAQDEHYIGISQSRNRGHQNALLAGLMEVLHSGTCDITISIDCDGQDDINAMDEMVQKVSWTEPRWCTVCAAAGTPTPSSSGSPPRASIT